MKKRRMEIKMRFTKGHMNKMNLSLPALAWNAEERTMEKGENGKGQEMRVKSTEMMIDLVL